jgi:hypothetical protein
VATVGIADGDLREWQRQIEHFPWVDLASEDEIDQLRQITTYGRRTAVQMYMRGGSPMDVRSPD